MDVPMRVDGGPGRRIGYGWDVRGEGRGGGGGGGCGGGCEGRGLEN